MYRDGVIWGYNAVERAENVQGQRKMGLNCCRKGWSCTGMEWDGFMLQ